MAACFIGMTRRPSAGDSATTRGRDIAGVVSDAGSAIASARTQHAAAPGVRSRRRGRLLHRPPVAVRIREEAEATPRVLLHRCDFDATPDEKGAGLVQVFD